MREQLARFFTALGYFTRLPVPAWVEWVPERLAHAAAWLPLVGWVVGCAGAAALLVLASLLPASLAVILSMALTVRLTGALPVYGLVQRVKTIQQPIMQQGFLLVRLWPAHGM